MTEQRWSLAGSAGSQTWAQEFNSADSPGSTESLSTTHAIASRLTSLSVPPMSPTPHGPTALAPPGVHQGHRVGPLLSGVEVRQHGEARWEQAAQGGAHGAAAQEDAAQRGGLEARRNSGGARSVGVQEAEDGWGAVLFLNGEGEYG